MAYGVLQTLQWIGRHPMNQGRRFGAYCDWLAWQVSARLRGRCQVAWIEGLRVQTGLGDHGFTSNIATGLAEFEAMAFLLHYLQVGDLFVDVGANVGSYSLLAGSRGARLIAVEPSPEAEKKLRDNLHLNGFAAEVHRCAVGATVGSLAMALHKGAASHADPTGTPVPMDKLDQLLKGRKPALIKIDVEGFEAAVLAGADATLQQLPALIIESWGDQALHHRLETCGLTLCRYQPLTRHLAAKAPDDAGFAQSELFVRDFQATQERLRAAPPIHWRDRSF